MRPESRLLDARRRASRWHSYTGLLAFDPPPSRSNGDTMKRLGVLILITTLGALTLAAGAGAQSITIGQAASDPSATCNVDLVVFNSATRPAGPSYVVPAGAWTISSFSIAGGAGGGSAAL